MLQREREPKLCTNCKAGTGCLSTSATCHELRETYDAGRGDFADEVGRTWPEEEEMDLEPEEVLDRVAALLESESMHKRKRAELKAAFELEITNQMDEIDPGKEQAWYSLVLGWAIGKGCQPSEAHTFTIWIRGELSK
jgi:hypothetical protein